MNLEQRTRQMDQVHKLEGLLAYANQTGDKDEAERIRKELVALVEQCGDGCCCG